MSIIEINNPSIAIVGKLSIERCQTHLAHLHALMHLSREENSSDNFITESVLGVMESIERELAHSARMLGMFG